MCHRQIEGSFQKAEIFGLSHPSEGMDHHNSDSSSA